jgi:hypothetical protein
VGVIMFLARTLIIVIATTQIGFAATEVRSPTLARLISGEESLEELIVFPNVPGDLIVNVYCTGQVSSQGKMKRNLCFRSEHVDQAFRDAIDAAAKSAKSTPAVVSGELYRVTLWYRVVFARKDDRSIVRVHPNWGRDFDKYGNDYEGPQRITRMTNPRFCTRMINIDAADSVRFGFEKPSIFFVASLSIDAGGKPASEVAFESAGNLELSHCRSSVRDRLRNAEYIPGHHNGNPVETTYVLPLGNYRDMEFR